MMNEEAKMEEVFSHWTNCFVDLSLVRLPYTAEEARSQQHPDPESVQALPGCPRQTGYYYFLLSAHSPMTWRPVEDKVSALQMQQKWHF
jgi:hypothetical protein